MSNYQALLSSINQLSPNERLEIIDAIWRTMPEETFPPLSDDWREEVSRRSAEFDQGTVETIPWRQVRAEALKRIGVDENR